MLATFILSAFVKVFNKCTILTINTLLILIELNNHLVLMWDKKMKGIASAWIAFSIKGTIAMADCFFA